MTSESKSILAAKGSRVGFPPPPKSVSSGSILVQQSTTGGRRDAALTTPVPRRVVGCGFGVAGAGLAFPAMPVSP
eukprot:9838240-Prorocentrum_lima.AAC.1